MESETLEIYDGSKGAFTSFLVTEEELIANDHKAQVERKKIGLEYSPTLEHSTRVADLSSSIAEAMSLSPLMVHIIAQTALIHDVGKIKISSETLNKSSLDKEEISTVHQHVIYTGDILEKWGITEPIRLLAGQHHERQDGSGYPCHLKGKEIHQAASIIAVVDALDAAYSRPWGNMPDLMKELKESGRYNPNVVTIALESFSTNHRLIGV